jgi:hypothetical protein
VDCGTGLLFNPIGLGVPGGFAPYFGAISGSKLRSDDETRNFRPTSGVGLNLSCCSKKPLPGDTSFSEANKGFQKELTPEQRKAAIKNLQTETASKP